MLLLRHADPVEKKDKFYGGGVSLLLAYTPEERDGFRRWAELNDPSRIFGYNTAGIFSRSVETKHTLTLPAVRVFQSESLDAGLYRSTAMKSEPLKFEPRNVHFALPRQITPAKKVPFAADGLPVYDEKGNIVSRLKGIPEPPVDSALLIRAGSYMGGTEFRVVGSSGDRGFDRNVTRALSKLADKGQQFSGTLAVWPDSKEKK